MHTLILKARRPSIRYVLIALMPVYAMLYCGVSQAAPTPSLNCSATTADNLNFGNVDALAGIASGVSGIISYSCTNTQNNSNGSVLLCFNIGTGTNSTSSYDPRQINATPTGALQYRIYRDGPGGQIWGNTNATTAFVPTFNMAKGDIASGTIIMYGSIAPNQNSITPGTYQSVFTAKLMWAADSTPNLTLNCSSATNSGGTFTFSVIANVIKRCAITATDLNFGAISNIGTASVNGSTQIGISCSNGLPFQVGLDNGVNSPGNTRNMKKTNGAELMRYELYRDASRSERWGNTKDSDTVSQTGTGSSVAINVYGQAYPAPGTTAGDYADTVTITLYY